MQVILKIVDVIKLIIYSKKINQYINLSWDAYTEN